MPPQPYIDRWIVLRVRVLHENSNIIYTFNMMGPIASPTEAQLTSLCSNFWTTFGSPLAALHGTQFTFALVEATARYAVGGAYGSFVPIVNSQGTKVGGAAPANVAAVISWKTGLSGRSYHGRSYFSGWVISDFLQSILTSAQVTALSNLAQSLITYAGVVGCATDFVVASIKNLSLTPINGYVIDNIGDSQRRRLPGRGY